MAESWNVSDCRSPNEIDDVINEYLTDVPVIKSNKKIEMYNVPCAFDIETTSFYRDGEKQAIMYEWTLGLNGGVIIGRTWDEFIRCVDRIVDACKITPNRRLMIFVHSLAFEFQFIRKLFDWDSVFASDERKPIYARTTSGIEFRCSYILSGYSLETLGNKLRKYPCEKLVGDLDYTKMRHNKTPLSPEELHYCYNDVMVVMSYIQECIENDGNISRIPLTKTGYVRNYCRNSCMYTGSHKKNTWKFLNYRALMNELVLSVDEYQQLKRGFQGGFTHANAFYSGKIMENVASYDFTSSYPAVMISEKFPMSKGEIVEVKTLKDLERNCSLYCCLFDVEIIGLESITLFEHPLSLSRCWRTEGVTEDNGRIVEAEHLKTTITEQDYFIMKKFYKWKHLKIGVFRRYRKGYLPTDFVKSILKLYNDKTTLKGVAGREDDYLRSKEMLNSCYGMCVTDICRDSLEYDGNDWNTLPCDFEKEIEKNNKSVKRFLFFAWGVWVTAYARRNLFSGIYSCGNDYIYSDTDSIKILNYEKHKAYINNYNELITQKISKALEHHKIPQEKAHPKTIEGIEKQLGVWDFEGVYTRFKTLGAKRYMTEKNGDVSMTVSGVNKKNAIPYLKKKFGKRIFEGFTNGLFIPKDYTGKMTHTYIDDEMCGTMVDYTGIESTYHELSGVHLENAEYSMNLSHAYIDYLLGIKEYNK